MTLVAQQKKETAPSFKKSIPVRKGTLAVVATESKKNLRKNRNQVKNSQGLLTLVAMASWTNDGAFWKTVDDET